MKVFNGFIQDNKKQVPQYLIFRCGMTQLKYPLNKLSKLLKHKKNY